MIRCFLAIFFILTKSVASDQVRRGELFRKMQVPLEFKNPKNAQATTRFPSSSVDSISIQVVLDSVGPLDFLFFLNETTTGAAERVSREKNLAPELFSELERKLINQLQSSGFLPHLYVRRHGLDFEVYHDTDVQSLVLSQFRGRRIHLEDMSFHRMLMEIEATLDKAGVPEQRRHFPLGTFNFPTLKSRSRPFKGIRAVYGPGNGALDDHLETVYGGLKEAGLFDVQKVHLDDVDPLDADHLYIFHPVLFLRSLPPYFIALQMEQFPSFEEFVSPSNYSSRGYDMFGNIYIRKLRAAYEVWEYSLENFRALKALGVDRIRHVPYMLPSDLSGANDARPLTSRSSHANFFGSPSSRRQTIIGQIAGTLHAASSDLVYNFDMSLKLQGPARYDTVISLNVHSEDESVLEVHRIFPLIASSVWVISERSDGEFENRSFPKQDLQLFSVHNKSLTDAWYDEKLAEIVDFVAPDQIADRVLQVLTQNPEDIARELERRRAALMKHWGSLSVLNSSGAVLFICEQLLCTNN